MLRKPLLVRLCCCVGIALCIALCIALLCGVFLSVAETIVGWPVWVLFSVFLNFCITLFDDYSKCGNY